MILGILLVVFVILGYAGLIAHAKEDLKNSKDIWDLMGFKD